MGESGMVSGERLELPTVGQRTLRPEMLGVGVMVMFKESSQACESLQEGGVVFALRL